jgi:hypothetical protein
LLSVEWVDPASIRFKISPHQDLAGTQDGDWDIERRYSLAEATKHRAIWQRFIDGKRWEDTELFTSLYQTRFDQGGTVRGAASMEALVAQYYSRVDSLFAAMKRNGFRVGHKTPLPVLLIGRGGEVFIGNQGNHRLAIAQVLGLKKFAGKVLCRHPLSRQ